MNDLEKFWRDAPAGTVVCAETGATKNMVLNSVIDGAKDLDSLRKAPVEEVAKVKGIGKNLAQKIRDHLNDLP